MRELFVEELNQVRGGHHREGHDRGPCPRITTLACGEESPNCSAC